MIRFGEVGRGWTKSGFSKDLTLKVSFLNSGRRVFLVIIENMHLTNLNLHVFR
jgi:hypothetical protein